MANPGLRISVGADVAGAVQGLRDLGNEARTTSSDMSKLGPATDRASAGLDRLRKNVDQTAETFRSLDAASNAAAASISNIAGRAPLQDISQLKSAVANLKADLKSGFAIPRIKIELGDQLKGVGPAATAAAAGLDKFKKASSSANAVVTDFSRIIADLPFGLVGIGNNIQQIPGSLQNLSVAAQASGKSVGSLLLSSVKGFGALGLAVSIVTSAFTIYQNGIAGFNKKTKEAKEATDEFTEALKASKDATAAGFAAIGGVQGNIIQIQALASAVRDETLSQTQRGNALEKLKSISKEYFNGITLTEEGLRALTDATNEYVKAITQQAIVQELVSEIGKVGAAYIKQRQAVQLLRDNLNQFAKDNGLERKLDANGRVIFEFGGAIEKARSKFRGLERDLKAQEEILDPLSQRFNELRNSLEDAQIELLKFRDPRGADAQKKETDALKQRIAALKELKDLTGLSLLQREELVRLQIELARRDGIQLGFTASEIEEQVQALIEKEFAGGEAKAVKLQLPIEIEQAPIDVAGAIGDTIPADAFDPIIKAIRENAALKLAGLQIDLANSIKETILNGAVEGLVSVGDTLGAVVAGIFGGEGFGAVLAAGAQNLFSIIGGVLQEVGKKVIVTSTLVKALKGILDKLFTPGGASAGIGAGLALVAFGGLLKNIKFNVPGFADGVTGFTGGLALVGERGPELVRLPSGSDVIPNNRLGELNAGAVFIATSEIRGEDIYTSYNRVGGRRRRI